MAGEVIITSMLDGMVSFLNYWLLALLYLCLCVCADVVV